MSDTNVVVVKGNLTRDADLSYTTSGVAFLKGSIANNVGYKSGDGWKEYANFFDFTLWGKRGESLAKYLTKGTGIIITGELHQSRWEQEGQKRNRIEIKVNDLSFAGGRGNPLEKQGIDGDFHEGGDSDFTDDFPDGIPF